MLEPGAFKMTSKFLLDKMFLGVSILFLLNTTPLFAHQKCEIEHQKAVHYYQNNEYEQAANQWKICIDKGIVQADLFYNLGNAYFKMNQIGYAILYYSSALRLDPGNEDYSYNLKYAQGFTKDKIDASSEENPILNTIYKIHHFFSLQTGLYAIIGLLWLISFLAVAKLYSKNPTFKNLSIASIFTLSIILAMFLLSVSYKVFVLETEHKGVVLTSSTNVTSTPQVQSQTLYELSEGTTFDIVSFHQGWVQIQLGDKIKGFVKESEIGVIHEF